MDLAALVISIVALILAVVVAGFGILVQLLTYRATSEQTGHVSESLAGFGSDLRAMIERLQGQTDTMAGMQRDQFNTMLDAFVTRRGAAEEVAAKTGESADRLQQISEEMDALKEDMRQAASADEVQHKLDELASRLEAVTDATARAARLAEAAARPAGAGGLADRERVAEITEDFLTSGRTRIGPATQAQMRLLLQDLVAGPGDAPWLMFKYGEGFKAAERAGLIETYHDAGQVGFGVRLTEAGRAFLGAGPPTKNGVAE